MSASPTSSSPNPPAQETQESALSLETVFTILRRRWYCFILFALLGAAGAYYWAGKQNYTFEKTASVMMKESGKDSSTDRIMTALGADTGATNLANESFILRSSTVMRATVEDLKLNISYWKKQDLRHIDLYRDSPILVVFETIAAERACAFDIILQNDGALSLVYQDESGNPVQVEGVLKTPINLPFATVSVYPTSHMTETVPGSAITVRRQPINAAADQLLANFTVKRPDSKESSLLQMTLTSTNPQKATDALNKLIKVYNDHSLDELRKTAKGKKKFIEERLVTIEKELKKSNESKNHIIGPNINNSDINTTVSADTSAVNALDQSIFDLETKIKLADSLENNLKTVIQKEGLISLETGIQDSSISRHLEAYNNAYLQYQKYAASGGGNNPVVAEPKKRMAANLKAVSSALADWRSNRELELTEYKKRKKNISQQITSTSQIVRQLEPVEQLHQVKQQLYLDLQRSLQEVNMSLEVSTPPASVLEVAHGSNAPIAPDTRKFVMGGAVGGIAFCMLIFMGVALLNNKVKNKHDLEVITNLPVIAELPAMSKKEQRKTSLILQDEHSVISEYFHILSHHVDSMLPVIENKGYVILLTSTIPGEGKTFISANLANTFSKTGKRVLLIDGDLRKTSLTKQLGGKGRKGLTTILLNKTGDPTSVIHPLPEHTGVDVLYAGPSVPNPVTLLSLPEMKPLFQFFRQIYDVVIIDAPPYGILADTAILAEQADISLYTIRSNRIDKRYVATIQQLADTGKLPNAGFVINAVDFKSASYHYYGYGYSYGYSYASTKKSKN